MVILILSFDFTILTLNLLKVPIAHRVHILKRIYLTLTLTLTLTQTAVVLLLITITRVDKIFMVIILGAKIWICWIILILIVIFKIIVLRISTTASITGVKMVLKWNKIGRSRERIIPWIEILVFFIIWIRRISNNLIIIRRDILVGYASRSSAEFKIKLK